MNQVINPLENLWLAIDAQGAVAGRAIHTLFHDAAAPASDQDFASQSSAQSAVVLGDGSKYQRQRLFRTRV